MGFHVESAWNRKRRFFPASSIVGSMVQAEGFLSGQYHPRGRMEFFVHSRGFTRHYKTSVL